jgi:hypothetical protein
MECFKRNAKRMPYAEFRSQGLFAGSGVVEAGCKTTIGQRLKLSGMHWTVKGANAIIALRWCGRLMSRSGMGKIPRLQAKPLGGLRQRECPKSENPVAASQLST